MNKFENQAAQGDIHLMKLDALPNGVNKEEPINNKYVLSHSETGHPHVIENQPGVEFFTGSHPFLRYLKVSTGGKGVELNHEKTGADKHKTIIVLDGIYRISRQRESAPEGYVRAKD